MRDLTPDEIKAAPDWATHYTIVDDTHILWESAPTFESDAITRHTTHPVQSIGLVPDRIIPMVYLPIPRKEFDISEAWNDDDAFDCYLDGTDEEKLIIDGEVNKRRAIFIAKHFKLTASDLL